MSAESTETDVYVDDYQSTSIIVIGADGSVSVYDENYELSYEDINFAYEKWIQSNGIMVKPFEHYTVSEGLLMIITGVVLVYFLMRIFRRKHYL